MAQSLQRGEAFEVLIKEKGWEYIKSYFQSKIQAFANSLLVEDNKQISDFENERREIIGLKKLLGFIDNDIKILEDDRQKVAASAKK